MEAFLSTITRLIYVVLYWWIPIGILSYHRRSHDENKRKLLQNWLLGPRCPRIIHQNSYIVCIRHGTIINVHTVLQYSQHNLQMLDQNPKQAKPQYNDSL